MESDGEMSSSDSEEEEHKSNECMHEHAQNVDDTDLIDIDSIKNPQQKQSVLEQTTTPSPKKSERFDTQNLPVLGQIGPYGKSISIKCSR